MKKLYKWLTEYIHTFIFAAYLVAGIVLMTPTEWWLLRVTVLCAEVAIAVVLAVGTHKKWPRYGDVEEKCEVAKPTDNTLCGIELAGDEMSLSEAIKVLEEGSWVNLLRDDGSQSTWDVRCELFDAQEIAVEAMKRELGQWVPVAEQLPTSLDANADNCVLAIHKASNKRYYHWRTVADNPFDFTHWMKVPSDP